MRNLVLLAGAATLGLTACNASKAEDGGLAGARTYAVGTFSKIEVAGPFDVSVSTGKQPGVSAQGPEKLLEKMVVEVKGDTLQIHPEKSRGWFGSSFRWNGGKAHVAVTVPMLSEAAIAGSGDLAVDRIATDSFKGSVAGSGGIKLGNVDVQRLELDIAGSGGMTAAGRAREARYEIAGSGNIDAGRTVSETARAGIAGSGDISAQATREAKVDIAGSGNVRITGGAECSVSKAGSGNVVCS